jgi:hypothetical protein
VRYERSRPGELVHIDVKKLGRIEGGAGKRVAGLGNSPYNSQRTDAAGKRRNTVGREYVHIAVDDHSRFAYAEVLPDEKAATAIGFLNRAVPPNGDATYVRQTASPIGTGPHVSKSGSAGHANVVADDDPFALDSHDTVPWHDGLVVVRTQPEVGEPCGSPDA